MGTGNESHRISKHINEYANCSKQREEGLSTSRENEKDSPFRLDESGKKLRNWHLAGTWTSVANLVFRKRENFFSRSESDNILLDFIFFISGTLKKENIDKFQTEKRDVCTCIYKRSLAAAMQNIDWSRARMDLVLDDMFVRMRTKINWENNFQRRRNEGPSQIS